MVESVGTATNVANHVKWSSNENWMLVLPETAWQNLLRGCRHQGQVLSEACHATGKSCQNNSQGDTP